MSNLSDQKLLSGKSVVIGYAASQGDPVDLDPVYYEGSFAYSSDGVMYYSNGAEWTISEGPVIRTPSALAPTNSTQQRQLRLTGFLVANPLLTYTQTGVIFEVSLSPNMSNPVLVRNFTSTNISSYSITLQDLADSGLTVGQTFYWHGKYTATEGQESKFSKTFAQVVPAIIDTPVAASTTTSGSLSISSFVGAYGDTYATTIWEIYSTANLSGTPLFTTTTSTSSPNSFYYYTTLVLDVGTTAYYRARYSSQQGRLSAWSNTASFTKPKPVEDPVSVTPNGTLAKELQISPYYSALELVYDSTRWEFYSRDTLVGGPILVLTGRDTDKKNFQSTLATLGLLATLAPIYWRARYTTTTGVSSEYTGLNYFVLPPSAANPTVLTTYDAETITLSISPFDSPLGVAYGVTEWEVYGTNSTRGTKLLATTNLLSTLTLPRDVAVDGSKYFWRARYIPVNGYESDWTELQRQTKPYTITQPTVLTISNTTAIELEISPYSSPYNVPYVETQWLLYTNVNNSPVATVVTTGTKLNVTAYILPGATFYWKARYRGADDRFSLYSVVKEQIRPVLNSIVTPTPITPNEYAGPTLEISGYATIQSIPYVSTEWQINSRIDFIGNNLYSAVNTGNTLTVPTNILSRSKYWRARYTGPNGIKSDWSEPRLAGAKPYRMYLIANDDPLTKLLVLNGPYKVFGVLS